MKFDLSHYDIAYYAKKKEQYEKGQAWKIEPFFYELDVEGKTVLDYGSAAGNMAKEAVKRNAKAVAAYDPIYDNHPEIVELIHSEGIDFLTTEKLRSVQDKFDLIFCSDVIEHVTPEEVDAFVADLVRFANAKSIICVNSPVKINLAFLVGRPLASETQGHINIMNPWRVTRLFKKHGFKLQRAPLILGISKKSFIKRLKRLPYPLNSIWGGHYFLRLVSTHHA